MPRAGRPITRNHQTRVRRRHRSVEGTSIDAFTPLAFSPVLWLDFSDPSTLYTDAGITLVTADGDAIYQANDKSTSANHVLQATLGARPTYKTGIVGRRSVARFDGGDDLASGAAIAEKPSTLFVVANVTGTTGARAMLGSTGADLEFRIDDTTNKPHIFQQATAEILIGTAGVTAATWYALSATFSSAGATALFTNGAANGTATNNVTLEGALLRIGTAAAEAYVGDIAEVLIYNTVLAAANHNTIGNYLAYKYGLTWTAVT